MAAAVQVREATAGDARGIAEVHVRAWKAAYRGILPVQLLEGLSVDLREVEWHGRLGDDGPLTSTIVAEAQDGSVAGFCSLALPSRDEDAGERTAEVAATYVDPSRWSSGVGRVLLTRALTELPSGAWDDATLWIFLRNAQGRAFYARAGFRLDGASAVHEASRVKTARMRLSLGGAG